MRIVLSKTSKTITLTVDRDLRDRLNSLYPPRARVILAFNVEQRAAVVIPGEQGSLLCNGANYGSVTMPARRIHAWPQHDKLIFEGSILAPIAEGKQVTLPLGTNLPRARNLAPRHKSRRGTVETAAYKKPLVASNNLVMQVNEKTFGFWLPSDELLELAMALNSKGYAR